MLGSVVRTEFKSCPCCNKKASFIKVGKNHEGRKLYRIECRGNRCGLRTKNFFVPKYAFMAWNKRS